MFSGAELQALINEAAIRASMHEKSFVEQADLEEARDKVRFGRENRSRMPDEKDLRDTAYHEAGHALLFRLLPDVEPLHKVTIIPRGQSLGSTMMLPEKDRWNYTRKQLLGQIKVSFGGRIAEEIFLGDVSSGCYGDIQQATDIARRMVCDFGMSSLGPIRYASKEQQVFLGGEVTQPREFGEATADRIDTEVKRIMDDCYREAADLLRRHKDDVDLVARALLKHETLSSDEVERIIATRDPLSIEKAEKPPSRPAAVPAPAPRESGDDFEPIPA
jgi:cell division protease FtsH